MSELNRNQHYEFWVSYYQELYERGCLTDNGVERSNNGLTGHRWTTGTLEIPMQEQSLCFKVLYPGMLAGLGNTHFSQTTEGEVKLGFTFDPVTGLPYLPGSSVKGILRSAFLANWEYVAECLTDLQTDLTLNREQVKALELDIFGNYHNYDADKIRFYGEEGEELQFGGGKDIFFDAYPVKADSHDHLLGMENITPHLAKKAELQGLTNPNPLSLLKIMPGVVMQFRFKLTDSELKGFKATADIKKKLFQTILRDFGVGAKTNVGFGGLESVDTVKNACYLIQKPENALLDNRPTQKNKDDLNFSFDISSESEVRLNMVLKGRVFKIQGKNAIITLGKRDDGSFITGKVYFKTLPNCKSPGEIGKYLEIGKSYQFKVKEINIQYGINLVLT